MRGEFRDDKPSRAKQPKRSRAKPLKAESFVRRLGLLLLRTLEMDRSSVQSCTVSSEYTYDLGVRPPPLAGHGVLGDSVRLRKEGKTHLKSRICGSGSWTS